MRGPALVGWREILCIAARRCLYRDHELSIMHDMIEGVAGPIVCGEFGHEESPWGLVMNDMRAERRGEHVVHLLLMEPMGGSFGRFLPACRTASSVHGSVWLMWPNVAVSGMAPTVPGYIDSGSGLEFATWPLERCDGEAPSMKPGCVAPRFLLLTFLSLEESLQLSFACQLSSFDGLAPFRISSSPYQMNGFGKVWPSLPVIESVMFPQTAPMLRPHVL
ncbi:hypothetical protein CK203_076490 [Vitis vinifera]|uniref:Uncharacterized protein n=1 Tax=Vitis vinifera TaxID=29760 RepID=A0A438DB13_VITVI|nr:hypothetical protein CK203_076490 [Vitis vinifera]